MRRSKRWTWAVMAWLSLSLLVANAAPLMTEGGALVCSASGTKWVSASNTDAPTANIDATSHTWHCSLCLPFVAVTPDLPGWAAQPCAASIPPGVVVASWVPPTLSPYGARAPPRLLNV